jgi:hypothetical protein
MNTVWRRAETLVHIQRTRGGTAERTEGFEGGMGRSCVIGVERRDRRC